MLYFATFLPGVEPVIEDVLRAQGVAAIRRTLEGAVLYEHSHFVNAACMNNTFEVIARERARGGHPIDAFGEGLLKSRKPWLSPLRSKRAGSFRIVTSLENQLVSMNPRTRAALEARIGKETGLSLRRAGAQVEFWLLCRSEGTCYFLKRLTHGRVGEKQLQKGELRPEVCYLLNWVAGVDRRDVFLDPFCGSGAIPASRMRLGGYGAICAIDSDKEKTRHARERLAKTPGYAGDKVRVEEGDACALSGKVSGVTKIVTDPPWGFYESCDVAVLYPRMLKSFLDISMPGAVFVVLSARKEALETALLACGDALRLTARYDVLLSGKKAAIFRLVKN